MFFSCRTVDAPAFVVDHMLVDAEKLPPPYGPDGWAVPSGYRWKGEAALGPNLNASQPLKIVFMGTPELAAHILERSSASIRWIKQQVDLGIDMDLEAALRFDLDRRLRRESGRHS